MNYPTTPTVNELPVPDPLNPSTGRVDSPEVWAGRVPALKQDIIGLMYGELPPEPDGIQVETLCHNRVRRWPDRPLNISYRIHCRGGQKPFVFCARVLAPDTPDRNRRSGGLYEIYPDRTFGAISAWAWGYHRLNLRKILSKSVLGPKLPPLSSGHATRTSCTVARAQSSGGRSRPCSTASLLDGSHFRPSGLCI